MEDRLHEYTDYKFEVELWQKFTKAEVKSQGFAVYSSLPHENDAHDRVRLAIQNKEIDLDNDTAVASIFKTLDKYYKKDDISSVFEAWTSFKVFSRGQNETIQQFLNNYDQQINELKKQNIVLPQVVLALQLLDCAKLEKKETQIVMTAVDYTKKETLYEQMKTALNKFLGEQCLSIGQTMNVKTEPVFTANIETEDEEMYFTRNFRGSRGGYRGQRGARHAYSYGQRQRGDRWTARGPSYPRGGGQWSQTGGRGRRNPKDESGQYMKCNLCESVMHFRRFCPHAEQAYAQ